MSLISEHGQNAMPQNVLVYEKHGEEVEEAARKLDIGRHGSNC